MFKIDQLIIIGGPSLAGKSSLIEKIRQGDCPRLCEQLGIAIPSSWLYVGVKRLAHIRQPIIERLVVHFDICSRYSQKNGFTYLHELINTNISYLHELINISDRVTILTLYVPPKILIQRSNFRLLKSLFRLSLSRVYRRKKHHLHLLGSINRQWKRRKAYKHGFSMLLYEKWFNFFNQSGVTTHWVLDFNKSNIMIAHPYKTDKVGTFTGVKKVMDN